RQHGGLGGFAPRHAGRILIHSAKATAAALLMPDRAIDAAKHAFLVKPREDQPATHLNRRYWYAPVPAPNWLFAPRTARRPPQLGQSPPHQLSKSPPHLLTLFLRHRRLNGPLRKAGHIDSAGRAKACESPRQPHLEPEMLLNAGPAVL